MPPETMSSPYMCCNTSERCFAFLTTCSAYSLNSGRTASPNATAIPAMLFICGPPFSNGNTDLSIVFANSFLHSIIAPLAPRSVLCVVIVTTSAYGIGEGYAPPAINPATCATSATK